MHTLSQGSPHQQNSCTQAAKAIGDKGNQAVHDYLAVALAQCKIPGLNVIFCLCNLSADSVKLLAKAVEKNETMGKFSCMLNFIEHPKFADYNPTIKDVMKSAIIASKAPITEWNGQPLPADLVEARRRHRTSAPMVARVATISPILAMARVAAKVTATPPVLATFNAPSPTLTSAGDTDHSVDDVTRALIGLNISAKEAEVYALKLGNEGYDSLKTLVCLDENDLDKAGITKSFHRKMILKLVSELSHSASPPVMITSVASLPALPAPLKFYGFASHNWGENDVNHKRVMRIAEAFKNANKPLWFDENPGLGGDFLAKLTQGVDECATFIVFITAAYVDKVKFGPTSDNTDWCYREFNYASHHKPSKMIAVVMEPEMKPPTKWKGSVGAILGNHIWVDYTSEDKFEECCNMLAGYIAEKMAEKI